MYNIFPNKASTTLIIFLVILNVISWSAYASRGRALEKSQNINTGIEQSRNIMAFQKLFIDKVLKSDGVVDYDTRRELEQAVGKTNDDTIINAWNSFLGSKTEADGQAKVKELLSVITERVYAE